MIVTEGAKRGKSNVAESLEAARAVDIGGLQHICGNALHIGNKDHRRISKESPDIGNGHTYKRKLRLSQPGSRQRIQMEKFQYHIYQAIGVINIGKCVGNNHGTDDRRGEQKRAQEVRAPHFLIQSQRKKQPQNVLDQG